MQQIIDNLEKDDEEKLNNELKYSEKKENKPSYLRRFYEDIKSGIKKNYKTIILITVVSIIILYMNYPKNSNEGISLKNIKKMFGGDNEAGGENEGNMNEEKKKKKGVLGRMASPLDGANSVMWWVIKNITLLYIFLIFLIFFLFLNTK